MILFLMYSPLLYTDFICHVSACLHARERERISKNRIRSLQRVISTFEHIGWSKPQL